MTAPRSLRRRLLLLAIAPGLLWISLPAAKPTAPVLPASPKFAATPSPASAAPASAPPPTSGQTSERAVGSDEAAPVAGSAAPSDLVVRVLDHRGEPVEFGWGRLWIEFEADPDRLERQLLAMPDRRVEVGRIELPAAALRGVRWWFECLGGREDSLRTRGVISGSGPLTSPVEMRLPPARRISGICLDEEESPMAGVSVEARPTAWGPYEGKGGGPVLPLRGKVHGSTRTDARGEFRLGDLGDADYVLVVSPPDDYVAVDVDGVRPGDHGLRIRLGRGRRFDVEVREPAGGPAANATVVAWRESRAGRSLVFTAETDARGRCRTPAVDPDVELELVAFSLPPDDVREVRVERWRPRDCILTLGPE